jgi:hypothetical protein
MYDGLLSLTSTLINQCYYYHLNESKLILEGELEETLTFGIDRNGLIVSNIYKVICFKV